MSSAIEQLAANINFSTFKKAEDLKKRIWFTLAALVVYRLGTYIPLPGINPLIIQEFVRTNSGGILGTLDMFSGGSITRMTIFALNIMPYISSSIIVQLMTSISPHLEALKKEGEVGRNSQFEAPIHASNVMLYNAEKKIASRITIKTDSNGAKIRVLKKLT